MVGEHRTGGPFPTAVVCVIEPVAAQGLRDEAAGRRGTRAWESLVVGVVHSGASSVFPAHKDLVIL